MPINRLKYKKDTNNLDQKKLFIVTDDGKINENTGNIPEERINRMQLFRIILSLVSGLYVFINRNSNIIGYNVCNNNILGSKCKEKKGEIQGVLIISFIAAIIVAILGLIIPDVLLSATIYRFLNRDGNYFGGRLYTPFVNQEKITVKREDTSVIKISDDNESMIIFDYTDETKRYNLSDLTDLTDETDLKNTDSENKSIYILKKNTTPNNGQSIVTSIAIASNVATCVHDGQIAALTTGDRIRITENNGQTNGERIVGTVLSSTSFTFALVTADATFSGGLMTYATTPSNLEAVKVEERNLGIGNENANRIVLIGSKKILKDFKNEIGKYVLLKEYNNGDLNLTVNTTGTTTSTQVTSLSKITKVYQELELSSYGGKSGIWVLLENSSDRNPTEADNEIDNNEEQDNIPSKNEESMLNTPLNITDQNKNVGINRFIYSEKVFLKQETDLDQDYSVKVDDKTAENPRKKYYALHEELIPTTEKKPLTEKWYITNRGTLTNAAIPASPFLPWLLKIFISLSITLLPLLRSFKTKLTWPKKIPIIGGKPIISWMGGSKFMKLVNNGISIFDNQEPTPLGVFSNSRTVFITITTMITLFYISYLSQTYVSSLFGRIGLGEVGTLIKKFKDNETGGVLIDDRALQSKFPGLSEYGED